MAKEKSDKSVKKPRAAKGSKKEKDPNAPKKNQSGYMIFCSENRAVVKEENPDATFGELGKLLGQKWKELDEAAKKPYADKAETDKKRYEREKAAYDAKPKAAAKSNDEEEEEEEEE